jgi:hypothetical protein
MASYAQAEPLSKSIALLTLLSTYGFCCTLQQDDLPQIRSMLPKPDELKEITTAKNRAFREHSAKVAAMAAGSSGSNGSRARISCSSSSDGEPVLLPPRLGVVEAAFETLGGVRMLMAKMRACEFK